VMDQVSHPYKTIDRIKILRNSSEPDYLRRNYRNTMAVSVCQKFLVVKNKMLIAAKFFGLIC
jgi:hypothetical protein